MAGLTQTSAPATEPVTTAEAKTFARVDSSAEDTLIGSYITAAREWVETFTCRQLVTATWALRLDGFPGCCESDWFGGYGEIVVPLPPLQSVSSIAYVDGNGATQTLSSALYQTDIYGQPGRIMPAYGQSWPLTRLDTYNVVTVTFVAGYGAAAAVLESFKTAIKLIVTHWLEHRGDDDESASPDSLIDVPNAAKMLMWPYRMARFGALGE